MKRALFLVIGILLFSTADGPPKREDSISPVYFFNGALVLLSPNEQIWVELWLGGYRSARERFTEPASPKLDQLYRGVLRDIGAWKFTFTEPTLSQTTNSSHWFVFNSYSVIYGRYFSELNHILVNQEVARTMTPIELRVLLAHEVGHSIDIQTNRKGHWIFVQEVQDYGKQAFADYIARLIIGGDAVEAFEKKYVGAPQP